MDGAAPLVSVIMSVYNGEKWLKAAIESIISQTHDNWEFIIIDDNSNTATKSIIAEYSDNLKFKIISNKSRAGLTKNLNTAIAYCKGEYIARMDADDISLPARFEKQLSLMQKKNNVSVVCSFVELINENNKSGNIWKDDRKANSPAKIKRMLPFRNCIAHPTVMFRKNILADYKYNENQVDSQDWDMWLQLSAAGKLIEKINEPLLLYRVHVQSVTFTSLEKSVFLKKSRVYKEYLRVVWHKKKFNFFNTKVMIAFLLNSVKLFLSKIKRKIIS